MTYLRSLCSAAAVAALAFVATGAERPGSPKTAAKTGKSIVALTVEETAGAERSGVAITAGLPLAKDAVKDLKELALVAGGKPLPAQFKTVMKWPDGSLRWALGTFVLEKVPAGGKVPVTLALATGGGNATGAVLASEVGGKIVVDTGVLKFSVKQKNFNLIDEAWLDPSGAGGYTEATQIIKSHAGGGPQVTVGGKVFAASADADCQVEIEENGPVACVIKATGAHKSGTEKKLDYMVRIYAYAGRSHVRVVYAWINRQGKRPERIDLEDVSLVLPTAIKGGVKARLGGEKEPHSFDLAEGKSGWIYQKSKEAYELGGAAGNGGGGGIDGKVFTTGWGSVDDGKLGLAAGRRWFWQMHPTEVEVTGRPEGAEIALRFWTGRSGKTTEAYTGVARTHYLMLDFFKAAGRKASATRMLDLNKPLYALAPPAYYCQDTCALGKLASAAEALYDAQSWKAVVAHDRSLEKQIDWILSKRRAHRGKYESYGYRYFGDFVHYPEKKPGIKWDGNYYDFPHAAFQHFLRTGKRKYFDIFEDTYPNVQDICLVHYDPSANMIGASRYCPSNDQVVMEGKSVYVSNTFNHWKNQSLVEAYLMTGERWAMDVANLAYNHALTYKGADGAYNQPRGPGILMTSLVYGNMLTGDGKYLDRVKEVAAKGYGVQAKNKGLYAKRENGYFQLGITMEGYLMAYQAMGDDKLSESLQKNADAMMATSWKGGKFTGKVAHQCGNSAAAFAFLARKTGKAEYGDVARFLLSNIRRMDKLKDAGMVYRNTAYACYYLSKLSEKDFQK